MGRKIPAKKHRGVKDPLLQQVKRLESLKGKINAPPRDPDEQPMPRSLLRLFGLPDLNERKIAKKNARIKKRPLAYQKDESVSCSSDNPVSRLHKLPGESGRSFSLRINSAIKALHGADEDLEYPHDLEAEDYKGQRMAERRERRAKKRRRAEKAAGKKGEGANTEEHLTRTQKLALKKKAKKMKALEAGAERAALAPERVAFGDVAHAPPALRRAQPGRRELLLSAMLRGGAGGAGSGAGGAGNGAGGAVGEAGDAADRARRERARLDAVAAYRALKASKQKNK